MPVATDIVSLVGTRLRSLANRRVFLFRIHRDGNKIFLLIKENKGAFLHRNTPLFSLISSTISRTSSGVHFYIPGVPRLLVWPYRLSVSIEHLSRWRRRTAR